MASAKIIERKEIEVAKVLSKAQESASVVVFKYQGLTVADLTKLRVDLRQEGVEIEIIKNGISRRVADALEMPELKEALIGPNAIAFSKDDAVAAARILKEFSKKKDCLVLEAGIVEGSYVNKDEIQAIAAIPSRDGLLTMLAGCMIAPLREITVGLNMLTEEKE